MPLIDDETESVEEEGERRFLRRRVDRFHQGAGDGALPLKRKIEGGTALDTDRF